MENNKTIQEAMSLLGQQQHDYILSMLKDAKERGYQRAREEFADWLEKKMKHNNGIYWYDVEDKIKQLRKNEGEKV